MVLGDSELGRSVFYAFIPTESGTGHRRATSATKHTLPLVRNVRTIVAD